MSKLLKQTNKGYRLISPHVFDSIPQTKEHIPILHQEHIDYFQENGHLAFKKFLKPEIVSHLKARYQPLFDGKFDTGVYPDEWYGRTGMSLPLVTKQICGGWKSDLFVASIALSSQLHCVTSQLNDWNGSRIAQDNLLMKLPNGGTSVGFHQDSEYISLQFTPIQNNSVTCWLPLDDASLTKGTVEYISGSHKWENIQPDKIVTTEPGGFHAGKDINDDNIDNDNHRMKFIQMMNELQIRDIQYGNSYDDLDFSCIEIPAGGIAFHHQNIWHGSGINITNDMRRVLAVHTLNSDCKFRMDKQYIGYIHGKYVKYKKDNNGSLIKQNDLDEGFYPICWSKDGYRSEWLNDYCKNDHILQQ